MGRVRSRQVETQSVNQRMLRRGAVKRQHVSRWAIGSTELAPGVVGGTHLHPTAIERIREEAAGSSGHGVTIALSAEAAQTIPAGGIALELTDVTVGPRRAGFDSVSVPTTSIAVDSDCVASVLVRFRWDDWRAGGVVRLMRGAVVVDEAPPSWGPRFSGVLHAGAVEAGEELSVVVDHGDASGHDVVEASVVVRVEGASQAAAASPVGLYAVTWLQGSTLLSVRRFDENGEADLGTAAPASTTTEFVGIRVLMVGNRIRTRVWEWADPEPSTWHIDVTDPAPLQPGFVGVTSTLTGSAGLGGTYREYDSVEVSFDGATPVSTDFSEYADGGLPADWQVLIGAGGANWEIISGGGSYDGGKFLGYPLVSPNGAYVGWTGAGSGSDVNVLVRARAGEDNTALGVVVRGNPL